MRSVNWQRVASFLCFFGTFLQALTSPPASLASDYDDAVNLYQKRDYTNASVGFAKIVSRESSNSSACYYFALSLQQLGKYSQAKTLYRLITQKFPNTEVARLSAQAFNQLDRRGIKDADVAAAQTPNLAGEANSDVLPDDVKVPFTRSSGHHFMIKATLNGRPMDMIFDTGAEMCAFGKKHLTQAYIAMPTGEATGAASGVGGVVKTWTMPLQIGVGGIKRTINAVIQEKLDVDPLLGESFFCDYVYDIDIQGGVIRFTKRSKAKESYPADNIAVPFTLMGKEMVVEAKLNGHPLKMIFDTGAASNVIGMMQLVMLGIHPTDAVATGARGIGGTMTGIAFNADSVELGAIRKSSVPFTALNGYSMPPLLGQPFFGNRRFTIDNENRVIHFWP
jgi:predicted aspartyl protease